MKTIRQVKGAADSQRFFNELSGQLLHESIGRSRPQLVKEHHHSKDILPGVRQGGGVILLNISHGHVEKVSAFSNEDRPDPGDEG